MEMSREIESAVLDGCLEQAGSIGDRGRDEPYAGARVGLPTNLSIGFKRQWIENHKLQAEHVQFLIIMLQQSTHYPTFRIDEVKLLLATILHLGGGYSDDQPVAALRTSVGE